MDDETRAVITSVRQFLDEVVEGARAEHAGRGRAVLGTVVAEHLGVPPSDLPVVRLEVDEHQFVNLDIAVEHLLNEHGGGEVVGIAGDARHHQTFGDMVAHTHQWANCFVGAVDRAQLDTGPGSARNVVSLGVHLFRYRGVPVAMLQRQINPQFGGQLNGLELMAAQDVCGALTEDLRRLMEEHSVFRGQVLAFGDPDPMMHHRGIGAISFLPRPQVPADRVILPDGVLERVDRHVIGAARHRERLLAAGQHLKRGLLLFGPPGTGKTHTVRYLLGASTPATCILLTGSALRFVGVAATMARALQPAVVVIEDVDLIAEHREMHDGPQPLLFTLLEAMDGLAAEADVAFVLTTNRADLLEAALAQRPGRVDLAVQIPLPDRAQRRQLLELYAADLGLPEQSLDRAAERTAGCTASFFKELTRRAVLLAAEADRAADAATFDQALSELLAATEQLTRVLLGSDAPEPDAEGHPDR